MSEENQDNDDLKRKVADLERRIKDLEARPRETHTHFHSYPPVFQQPIAPYVSPAAPGTPWYPPYRITCGDTGITNSGTGNFCETPTVLEIH